MPWNRERLWVCPSWCDESHRYLCQLTRLTLCVQTRPLLDTVKPRAVVMSEPKAPIPAPGDTYKGWLFKWTNYIKGYQRRWFVLSNGLLSYYRWVCDMLLIYQSLETTFFKSGFASVRQQVSQFLIGTSDVLLNHSSCCQVFFALSPISDKVQRFRWWNYLIFLVWQALLLE